MFSLTVNTPKPLSLPSTFLPHHPLPFPQHQHQHQHQHHKATLSKPISATITPSSPNPSQQQQQLYQPFRPPPSSLPSKFSSLDIAGRLDILANRLGLWFEYAPLIPTLFQEGFSPSSLEEVTGISGVDQNRLVVAAQVRDSLIQSSTDPVTLSFFDNGGAELLYEFASSAPPNAPPPHATSSRTSSMRRALRIWLEP
ncbi:hypothetical protein HYC85_014104 [Camellia sinensis]|uniref:Rubisco accumulation factor 1 helix turn helix domain-containing protein n=1 Tax=Camellia sinensis TaxID=4442 RepID=A0A7J7H6I5_CAMSI|nr:hypothetical protein HYC85_014104 [Camellia sinensis]